MTRCPSQAPSQALAVLQVWLSSARSILTAWLAPLDFSDIRTTFPAPACTKPAELDVYDGDVVYDFGVGEEKALR